MRKAKRINVGIIGCGGISKFHLEGYKKAGANIKWVCDTNEDLAKETASHYGARFSKDCHALFNDSIDCVSVCLPNYLHAKVGLECLEAGKHVLCEKPMTATLAEAETLVTKVKNAGLIFQVNYMKRFHPAFKLVKELIPAIGRIQTSHFRAFHHAPSSFWQRKDENNWATDDSKPGGLALPHSGSHFLDIMRWYCGDPVVVDARVMKKPGWKVDYMDTCFFEFSGEKIAFFEVAWQPLSKVGLRQDGWDEKIELNGEKGRIELYSILWHANGTCLVRHYLEKNQKTVEYYITQDARQFDESVQSFVTAVRTKRRPSPDVVDGYKVQAIMDAIYESGRKKKQVKISYKA